MILTYIVKENNTYLNIKQVLKEEFLISDRLCLKLKTNNKIFLNKVPVYITHFVSVGDIIDVIIDFEEDNSNIVSTKMILDIIYEDECYLVLNKPAGIAIHPSHSHYDTSLSNGVKYYFDNIGLKRKLRPVNRLDKDTSRNSYIC